MMDKISLEKLKTLTILYVEDEEGIRKKFLIPSDIMLKRL